MSDSLPPESPANRSPPSGLR
ncbi:hypothetical protein E2C01_095962 [Portunus trituberculatus]|uniref:Uncharacterized protein n=1 Tax=Portunus trituberculatus TaxID=210409 RepID=A0A5B7K5N2_PORTR|nr:hypothetical protein [Portunus trituberculatus]